jgi:cytosine/creatinine deaminase
MDLIVRHARLRSRDELVDIGIADGRIVAVEPHLSGNAREEIDAGGNLTTPSFVEPHIHLDKALTAARTRENTTNVFEESIAIRR